LISRSQKRLRKYDILGNEFGKKEVRKSRLTGQYLKTTVLDSKQIVIKFGAH
jgi:hypothetical protein